MPQFSGKMHYLLLNSPDRADTPFSFWAQMEYERKREQTKLLVEICASNKKIKPKTANIFVRKKHKFAVIKINQWILE